jgi:ribosome biogenesis GTPase
VRNKVDIGGEALEAARAALAPYARLGYEISEVSAHEGLGVVELCAGLPAGMNVLFGHSGVGKSTLLNEMVPEADAWMGHLTGHGKGRHA